MDTQPSILLHRPPNDSMVRNTKAKDPHTHTHTCLQSTPSTVKAFPGEGSHCHSNWHLSEGAVQTGKATAKFSSPWAEEENFCSDLRAVDMGVMGLSGIQAVEPWSSGSWVFLHQFQDVNVAGSCVDATALSCLKGGERIPLRFTSPSGHLLCFLKLVKNVALLHTVPSLSGRHREPFVPLLTLAPSCSHHRVQSSSQDCVYPPASLPK